MKLKSVLALSVIPLLVVCSLLAQTAQGESWGPFLNFRQVDPTGRYYLVVKQIGEYSYEGGGGRPNDGTPVEFALVERKPGSPPVTEAHDKEIRTIEDFDDIEKNPEVKVREGDIVLGRGKLDLVPRLFCISSTGLGFVGLGVRSIHGGDDLIIVDKVGNVIHRKNALDLYTEKEFNLTGGESGGIFGRVVYWIDEKRKEVILAIYPYDWDNNKFHPALIRVVNLETGKVRKGSKPEIVTILEEAQPGSLDAVLDFVNHRQISVGIDLKLVEAGKPLAAIMNDSARPLVTRMRAAVALRNFGDKSGVSLLKEAALVPDENQDYAIYHLEQVLGEEAVPVLCEVVRRFGCEVSDDARDLAPVGRAISHFSPKSKVIVLQLIKLLDERGKFAYDCQALAAQNLASMSKECDVSAAVPALMKVLEDKVRTKEEQKSNHQWAAIVLGEIGSDAKAALPLLIDLAKQSNQAEWERVKDANPDYILAPGSPQNWSYSDDCFVNAICRIRRE